MKTHLYFLLVCLFSFTFGVMGQQTANAANPGIISFQGKVVNADGTNVVNGTYNFDFVMFDDPTAGTNRWNELTKSVQVTNGIFQTNLGSLTALPDFNAFPSLYLAVRFNADAAGYMSPRVQMASVPYALNSDKVGGVAASGLVQLGASQSGNINISSGTITSGLINSQTITAAANFTGTLTIQGASALTLGTASINSGAIIMRSLGGANTVTIQAPDTNPTASYALKLPITAPALNQCLQNNATTIGELVFASCAVGAGDNVTVNGSAATDANFLNTAASASIAGTTFGIAGSSPSNITVTVSDASATMSGVITANAQVLSGLKTFNDGINVTATVVPTVDQVAITNAGQAVTTAGVNGISVNYVGGAAAVEASGARINLTPGTTSGGTWSGLRIVANATGPVSGVTEYGIKIEGPTSAGAGTETGMYIGTGWDTGLDVQSGGITLAAVTSGGNPSDLTSPVGDNLRIYTKKISGRVLLKFIGSSGVDSPFQPALFGNNVIMFTPGSGATITANANGFGTSWTKGSSTGTAVTSTPTSTAPAITNQIHRFRHQNVVTTQNQILGIQIGATDGNQFWTGNAAGLGGFFFNTRFIVEAFPATTVRIFAGLTSNANSSAAGTNIVTSDTVAGDVAGLWHDTTDVNTRFSFVTRNNVTTTKTAITLTNAIVAGNTYDFYMFAKPNDTTIYYRLTDLVNGVNYEGNTTITLPRNTIFMGPVVEMSNGTANTTVGTTAVGISRIYVESDL